MHDDSNQESIVCKANTPGLVWIDMFSHNQTCLAKFYLNILPIAVTIDFFFQIISPLQNGLYFILKQIIFKHQKLVSKKLQL